MKNVATLAAINGTARASPYQADAFYDALAADGQLMLSARKNMKPDGRDHFDRRKPHAVANVMAKNLS